MPDNWSAVELYIRAGSFTWLLLGACTTCSLIVQMPAIEVLCYMQLQNVYEHVEA